MSSRTVSVALQAKVDQYLAAMSAAAKGTDDVAKAAEAAGKKVDESTKGAGLAFADLSKQVGISVGESAGAAQKLSGVGAQWQKLQRTAVENKEAWNDVSGGLLKSGAAAGVAVALVTREYANFDQAMSGVASTGDDARQNIDALTEAAKKAGADTAYSAVEAANGVEELVRAGVSASDVLGGGLDGALSLAAAGQIEVAEAAGIASTAMTQFKLSGDKIPHVADLLAAGAGKAMGGVDDLGMALKQSGLVASQFGLSIEETVGGLSAFASAGLLGSDAGTSLKAMLLALANPAGATAKKMEELGISAYDAQGQFVGLEGLAGVLQERLGGLSDAQRQQALAQIFGNDAVRAASILYEEGADGIANWTAAVDDSGYAAETAATLQDNLRGDLEKLGGAFSTLAIEAGEAGNGPLRALVQSLTGIVDLAGQYPAAAQGILGIVAALSGLAIAGGALMKGVSFVAEFRTSLATLADTSPGLEKAASALGKLGAVAAGAAIGFAALSILGEVTDNLWGVAPAAEAAAAAMERLSQGEGVATLDSMFKTLEGKDIAQNVGDLASAFDVLSKVASGLDSGIGSYSSDDFFANLFGAESNLDRIQAQFTELDSAISQMSMADATQAFVGIRDASEAAGLPLEDLVALFPEYAAQIQQLAAANGLGELSAGQMASAMEGMYGPLTEVQAGMEGATTAAAAQAGAYDAAAAAAQQEAEAQAQAAEVARDALDAHLGLVDAITAVNDAQRAGANAVMGEQAAYDQWIASLQEASAQIEKNGKSLDSNTEAGRSNREYLRGLATDARDYTDAMRDNGASVDVLNAKMGEQRSAFIETANKFGVTGAAAEALADSYGLIPNYVSTTIVAPGAKVSTDEAAALNAQLEALPEEVRPDIVVIANTYGAEAAQAAIDAVKSKTVTVTVQHRVVGGSSAPVMGRSVAEADGGVLDFYARGGIRENHVAQIAPAGSWRVWAEPETGGEAYIPLAAAKRIRSLEIWRETGRRLGVTGPQYFANGAVLGPNATTGALSRPGDSYASVTNVTHQYHFEGREALGWLTDHLRDGQRRSYQTGGVHG